MRRQAARANQLLDVPNPEYWDERFTDRWPETQTQQQDYTRALHAFADDLEAARERGAPLEELQLWLRDRFGQRAVTRSMESFNERHGREVQAQNHGDTRSGGLFVPATPAILTGAAAATLAAVAARAHTNMGERR